jgi:hypothetical protein
MKKNKEFKGLWYIPSDPENKIGGTLIITPDKIVLELFGCYNTESESIIKTILENKVSTVETIHGDLIDSKKITLFNCRESLGINPSNSVHLSTYECRYVLEGLHLNSITDNFFNQISLHTPILSQWKHPAIIERSFYFCENSNKVKKVEVSADQASNWKKSFDITEGYQLTLSGNGQFNGNFEHTEFKFNQNTTLSIICKEKKTFSDLLEKVFLVCKFVTLATHTPVLITELFLYNDVMKQDSDPIKLYYVSRKESTEKVNSSNFLFTYDDISDIFPEVILKWFKESNRLAPIRNHLIASIQQKGYFSSLDFLTIIQSLEGYHQRFIGIDKILKERINDLIHNFNTIDLIRNSNIKVDRVVKTRNYYSHFYDRKGVELEGQELWEETNKLRVLLTCCILSLIGFNNSKINEILNKKNSIKSLL